MSSTALGPGEYARFCAEFKEYSLGSHYRANSLAIRSRAHAALREWVVLDRLPSLSLDEFDRHVWQLGSVGTRGEEFDWHHAEQVLAETPPDRFSALLDSGEIRFVGNQTWGSAVRTLRAFAHGRPLTEVEARMRQAITLLLHQPGPIQDRLRQVKDLGIGFGPNICSGLLMASNPREFILYNSRSEDCWADFGLDFACGLNWVRPYLHYNAFCRALLNDPGLDLRDLVDLDIFVYWHTVRYPSPRVKDATSTGRKRGRPPKSDASPKRGRGRQPKPRHGDVTLAQLRVTKQEMSPEQFRATWGTLYDRLVAEESAKVTTDLTAAELGQRAKRRMEEIHAFLRGQAGSLPPADTLCDWIHFCYALELYREASALLPYIREDEIDPTTYRRAKRVAEVCRGRLAG